jgi:Predicted pyridoxal phosphate-dependent enzyme apparently involved in regulation of cell wall biogenesis
MPGPGAYFFGEEERKELLDVMETGYLSRYGKEDDPMFKHKVVTFEKEFAKYIGTRNAVAVNGGTGALITSLAALGIGPGDEVIVPGYTFIASISSIIYAKAIPILAEIDESLNIDPKDIRKKLLKEQKLLCLFICLVIHVTWIVLWRLQRNLASMLLKTAARLSEQPIKGKSSVQ